MSTSFTPALFAFLRDLKAHNTREWFDANRDRYVADVETPMLAFIGAVAPALRAMSPSLVVDARRSGGSMFRIYRDTRFSADKSPYKTHVAAVFAHHRRKEAAAAPGFYLHLEPGDSMGGGGLYHPDSTTLSRVRLAIVENGRAWNAIKKTGIAIEGDRLTRAPAGFDPAHRFVDDLKLKDFYTLTPFTQKDVTSRDFLDRYVASCQRAAPLVEFLTRAMGWAW